MFNIPGQSYRGSLPPLTLQQEQIREQLTRHITMLAETIGERNILQYENLCQAAQYITNTFSKLGYQVNKQEYQVSKRAVQNIEIEITGCAQPNEIIVVGAHYDSVLNCPGANDNGSGIATILELARLLQGKACNKTLRLIAFVNEEPPFFYTSKMGSYVYAKQSRRRHENIKAMLSIETVGYYSDAAKSQHYPFPLSYFYPSQGDFIAFVSNLSSRKLLRQVIASFREHCQFPSEGAAIPAWITGVSWSDQWAFWRHGYPAMMITDTALFRYPYYHTEKDTPDKIDYQRLARVVSGLMTVIVNLAK